MSDVAVVLGMHRSGASAVAGVLTKLGCAAPEHLMPPNVGNARGYFESPLLMRFHDELLASAGSYWHDWRRFDPDWYGSHAAILFGKRARALFEQEFPNAPLAVLKDPRICRIAPFWIDLLREINATPRIVIPVRSPLDVAQSLKKRDAMPITKGLLLWLRHVLDAEMHSRALPRCIFTWDAFLSDWRGTCDKISSDIGLSWPHRPDQTAPKIEQFLGAELINNTSSRAELVAHSDVHEWTVGAYDALLELARNPHSNSARDRLDEIRKLFEASSSMFGRALIDYEIGLSDLRAQIQTYRGDNNRLLAQEQGLKAELAASNAERERFANESRSSQVTLAEIAAHLADETSKADQFKTELAELRRDRERLTNALATRDREIAAAANERARLYVKLQSREQALCEAADDKSMLASRAERAEAQIVAIKSEHEATLRKNGQLTVSLEHALTKLERIVTERELAARERDRLASALDQMSLDLRRMEREAANRSTIGAALSRTLTRAKDTFEPSICFLRNQLSDVERASAASRIVRERFAEWSGMLRLTNGSRRMERKLIASGLFDHDWYKNEYKDVAESGFSPALHYLEKGYLRGYRPNPFFDSAWYLERYEDVRRSGMNPLIHYILHGYSEGRDPGPEFETNFYLRTYPDVRLSGANPLAHYLHHGRAEGRLAVAPSTIFDKRGNPQKALSVKSA
jgi:hypothetical protein